MPDYKSMDTNISPFVSFVVFLFASFAVTSSHFTAKDVKLGTPVFKSMNTNISIFASFVVFHLRG